MTSFNSIALNGSTLTVNGTDYNLSLSQTAEATDSSLSSFKGVAVVDNGDGTISLTVGENSVVVEKYVKPMPVKGDLISMTLGNAAPAAGIANTYRVLKVNGTQAEVVAMFDQSTSQVFGSNSIYASSDLDTYLDTTWYNGLNATAKNAIVSKTFRQDSWYLRTNGNPDYNGTHWSSSNPATAYQVSLASATYGAEISRNVYALSVQDIIDYLEVTSSMTTTNTTLTAANVWMMFWNTTSTPSTATRPWLCSNNANGSNFVFCPAGPNGRLNAFPVANGNAARPAFTIDLSKIDFTINS